LCKHTIQKILDFQCNLNTPPIIPSGYASASRPTLLTEFLRSRITRRQGAATSDSKTSSNTWDNGDIILYKIVSLNDDAMLEVSKSNVKKTSISVRHDEGQALQGSWESTTEEMGLQTFPKSQ